MANKDITLMAEAIIKAHDGKAYYNIGEVSKIIGCGANTVPALLHESGITVRRVGPSKRISAYDIAELMCKDKIAPIDNIRRRATVLEA